MAKFRTHYDNLKVAKKAPIGVIKAAYKVLCQSYHPDKYEGSPEHAHQIMKLINEAYAVLSDPVKRTEHDKWIDKKIRELTLAAPAKENTDSHNNSAHNNNAGGYYSSQNYRETTQSKRNSWVA